MNEAAIEQILTFWFEECTPEDWFTADPARDTAMSVRFGDLHARAAAGELSDWGARGDGAMAEILLLDQFSRNIYRDKPEAFACDELARLRAKRALDHHYDEMAPDPWKIFFYLPFEHSESKPDQALALALISRLGDEAYTRYAQSHKDIIDRFGRFPYRNKILGRESTPEETAFLADWRGF